MLVTRLVTGQPGGKFSTGSHLTRAREWLPQSSVVTPCYRRGLTSHVRASGYIQAKLDNERSRSLTSHVRASGYGNENHSLK
jgi:hypothetical protein